MDEKTLDLLEFRKVQEMLAKEASTPLGSQAALEIVPRNAASARKEQELGREVLQALSRHTSPALQGAVDVRGRALRAKQGVTLSPKDLVDFVNVLGALDSLERWLREVDPKSPRLMGMRSKLPNLPDLCRRLSQVVDGEGNIKDSASPALHSIRRSIREAQDRIRRRAEEMLRRRDISEVLQEPIVTMRNQRFVIPVKQEYAGKIQGLIHDQSASGQTVFIEPVEILEMSNNLKRLELMERDEIERILIEVSHGVGDNAECIVAGVEALTEFDLALAKARLSRKWKGAFPTLSDDHVLHLVRAWHPLLKGNPVPMDISLDEGKVRTVVITGPNMGGKTVALKTCGLLCAMALSGMPCPAREETVVGDIADILCDIGDEQSIEENLSTFSAHISNVIRILNEARPGTLVLIDELGAGTDPQEGAALALAVLSRLNDSGALSVITSHYGELKVMAQERPGMQNASVEWDAVRLVPTYRLIVGVPGRSNAFLVAARLGLDPTVLEEARRNMREDVVRLDDVIQELEESSQRARLEAETAERERVRVEALRREFESKVISLERSRAKVLADAKAEALSIIQKARVEFEKAIREIREEAKKGQSVSGTAVAGIRERLSAAREDLLSQVDQGRIGSQKKPLQPDRIVPGIEVMVEGFAEKGVILEPPEPNGSVLVRIGAFTMRVDTQDLSEPSAYLDRAAKDRKAMALPVAQSQGISMEKARSISPEIDLRGMTQEEAYAALDKYLDDAVLASLSSVRIIHGKGTGALRKAVSQYLSEHPLILEQRMGGAAEGGSGVTVAKIRIT